MSKIATLNNRSEKNIARHFLSIADVNESQLKALLREAKKSKHSLKYREGALKGKTVALLFQKPSMRTRVAFEVAVLQLGGSVIYLGQENVQLGKREPIKDVARVLSGYVDAIVVRMFAHEEVEEFAQYSSVPVINGLSDAFHPCQALADLLTLQEHYGKLKGLNLSYIGDGNNVLHSLSHGCAMLGMNVTVSTPNGHKPDTAVWNKVASQARAHQASLTWEPNPIKAVKNTDVIYTDVWTSMGKEEEAKKRRKTFQAFQVNQKLLNSAKPQTQVMHCLPAHRNEEISDEVIEGKQSLIFDQAQNRLHVQKALLCWLLGSKK